MHEIRINNSVLRIEKGDLTMYDAEAIVFYARNDLMLGSGFGNAIAVRGGSAIQDELKKHSAKSTGEVVVTGGGMLKAKYIIHAVGPKFQEENTESGLKITIHNTLKAAEEKGIKKIAFPPMGTGFYGIPLDLSATLMLEVISDYLSGSTNIKEVCICVMDNRELNAFLKKIELLEKIEEKL